MIITPPGHVLLRDPVNNMQSIDYKSCWNARATSTAQALMAVDGSRDERTAQLTGAYSASQLRAALQLQAGDRVFELGCGAARIGRELAPEVGLWHGLDIAENMLAAARDRLRDQANTALDALTRSRLDPLADASMDKGYCIAVFIHMDKEDMVLYLRDVARVLRPGGLFYFDAWNLAHPVGWRRFDFEVNQAAQQPPGQRKDVARNQFCTPQEVELYVRAAGLEPVLTLTDSPWVQAVARKPDGSSDAALRAALGAAAAQIQYPALWTSLFDCILDAEFRGEPPHSALAALRHCALDDPLARMFRAWIHGAWTQRAADWGAPPDELEQGVNA
jgi:SAM-dependent methyltransferase